MKPRIVIIVEKGDIQDILSDQEVTLTLIDWDNIKNGDYIPDPIEEGNYDASLVRDIEISDAINEANSEIERIKTEVNDI